MEIFHNKYIPESLDDFKFSYFSVNLLKNLVKKPSNMPNLILSGMKTYDLILFVRALLNDMYGKDNLVYKKINLNCDGSEVAIKTSQYHYEFDMNFYKFTRRDLVLKFIDTVSKTINVSNQSYNIVVIKDAHLITHKVQAALRRTMELYVKSVRFIFLSKSCNNLVEAVQSRCSNILITGPNLKQSIKILLNISKLENIEIDTKTLAAIHYNSNNSFIDSLDILQLYQKNPKSIKFYNKYCPYKELLFYIKKADCNYFDIIEKKLYDLLMIDVPVHEIIRLLLDRIIKDKSIPDYIKIKATTIAADSEYRSLYGNKNIIHLNYYCVKLVQLINNK